MWARRAVQSLRGVRVRTSTSVAKPSQEQLAALKEKEAMPWNQLAKEERVQLYRAAYGKTRQELLQPDGDGKKVATGVAIGIAASAGIFMFLNSLAQNKPKTLTPEWKAATEKKKMEENLNPVFRS